MKCAVLLTVPGSPPRWRLQVSEPSGLPPSANGRRSLDSPGFHFPVSRVLCKGPAEAGEVQTLTEKARSLNKVTSRFPRLPRWGQSIFRTKEAVEWFKKFNFAHDKALYSHMGH